MPTRARTKPLSPGKKLTELAKLTTSPPRWKPSTWRALPMRELHSPPLDDGDDTRVSDAIAATPEVETPESAPSDPAERGERLAMLLGSGFVTVDDVLEDLAPRGQLGGDAVALGEAGGGGRVGPRGGERKGLGRGGRVVPRPAHHVARFLRDHQTQRARGVDA